MYIYIKQHIMENKKLYLFEDKVGIKWATWLAESRESRLSDALVVGSSKYLDTSRAKFLVALEKAINDGSITVFSGKVTLIDPDSN